MCGRFTKNYTWQQIHAMYRLNVPAAIPNMQPSFNVCPTDPVDTVVAHEGNRELVQMRWGLVPYWWNKPPKELRLATFNARIETVTTKPFFREPFKHRRCLIPVSGYYPELLSRENSVAASRGDNTEILGVLIEIERARARLSRSETRGRFFSSLGELLWYLTGKNRVDFIEPYTGD
jgi:hypothetical protein